MLRHGIDREHVLTLIEEEGGLTEDAVKRVSERTGVPEADIWGSASFYTLVNRPGKRLRVCKGLSCQMAGGGEALRGLEQRGIEHEGVSCLGQCDLAPAVLDEELRACTFGEDLKLERLIDSERHLSPANPNLPLNLAGQDEVTYAALQIARELGPDALLEQIEVSGLQGRGGAGFPAHFKWKSVASQQETERYVVCNADEGEPGTFKDRQVMLSRPHLMLEGLAIAAETIGTREIYIYLRGEFLDERASLDRALTEAPEHLAPYTFHIVLGHGAYICGEETALLESLEGKRGMPRLKPPFPTESGFRGKPTLIHNVETIACVPAILKRGGVWFREQGRAEAGTKLYCISGHVQKPGVYELPLGVTLEELVQAAGGYVGTPKAFSPGGASSGFLPMSERERPLDYKSLGQVGSMLGSAGVVVLNDTINMAHAARWQLEFFEDESCGQCAPCRIGTRYLHRALQKHMKGGRPEALTHAADVAWEMNEGSICGLGMVAAEPLQMARKYFPEDFETAHEHSGPSHE